MTTTETSMGVSILLSFGCAVAIVFVGADAWRAFKERKHWIPGDSLVLGALALQLLTLLNNPSLDLSFNDKTHSSPLQHACEYRRVIHDKWILILTGRVSTCVLMGCLLPGVARPLSTNLRTDMAALFISFALVAVFIISHEISIPPTAYKISGIRSCLLQMCHRSSILPRCTRWKLCSVREYWQIEVFWLSHLLDLIDSSKSHRRGRGGESYLTKVIVRLFRSVRLHRLLPLVVWLQIFLVCFSKGCWLLSQLLFSNNFFRKLVVGSASEGLYSLYTERASGETQMVRDPAYVKYKKACVTMQGENIAGLWIANKTSFQELKKRLRKGEEEGKICYELIELLTDKSSAGFSGQRCLEPGLPLGLEVESELNVSKRSCKMTAVSILSLIFELSTFIHNEGERKNMADKAIKACSQAWNIMDVVEYSDSEASVLIKAADELLHKLDKERKWLDLRLPMSDSADKSLEAAKAAVENMFERGKQVADAYSSRAWEEVAAAYSLCRLCRSIINDYEFNTVEGVVDGLEGVLADVIASCVSKAAQVIAEDCKKWATNLEEERIWKAAKIAGKVKAIMEKSGLILEPTSRFNIDQSAAGNGRHDFKRYEKSPTMTR